MIMTYQELLDQLSNLTPEQLSQPVIAYSGDIDDTIGVLSFHPNDEYNMGDPLDNWPKDQLLLILE